MFGKSQPEVVTEEDVGNFIAELNKQPQPIDEVMNYVSPDLAGDSTTTTSRTQD